MRGRALVVTITCGALLLAACSSEDTASQPAEDGSTTQPTDVEAGGPVERPGDGSWTVLQFSMADNNLEGDMVTDLLELSEVGSQPGLNVVALVDRSDANSDAEMGNLGDFSGAVVVDVQPGEFVVESELGDVNTGDPALLTQFLVEGITAHPADHYAFVISDHGASWPGIGPDESFGDMLELAELQSALSEAIETTGIGSFDVLGFDACLMASYEVASAMAPLGRYMIASEETEPGHGWDYRTFGVLAEGADAETFGRAVIDGFQAQAAEFGTDQKITLSLLDLAQLPALDEAMAAFVDAVVEQGAVIAPVIGIQRAATIEFGRGATDDQSSQVVDLRMLVSKIGVESLSLSPFTDDVERAVNDTVVYSIDSPATLGASGMTVYFPSESDYFLPQYAEAPSTEAWSRFLEAYYSAGAAIPETAQAQLVAGEPTVFFDEDGLNIQSVYAPEAAASLSEAFIRYAVVDADGGLLYLGREPATIFDDGTVQGIYDLTTLVISDGQDEATAYVDLRFDEEAGVGTIDVSVAYYPPGTEVGGPDAVEAVLSIVFDPESGDVLQETYFEVDTETGTFGELDADPEGIIVPELVQLDAEGNETTVLSSDVGLFADLPNLLYELRPHPSGTLLQIEIGVVDFGGNVDLQAAQVTVP